MLLIEYKDCNFKSMRTNLLFPKTLLRIVFLQFILVTGVSAQEKTNKEALLFAPLPEALVSGDGTVIESASQWESLRRDEVLQLFRDHVYGIVPEADLTITSHVKYMDRNALGGTAVAKEIEIMINNGNDSLGFSIMIYLPKNHSGPVPLFLGLNFNGNHTVHSDPNITVTDSWVRNNEKMYIQDHKATLSTRGSASNRWPLDLILSRGYGLATIYYGDIDPDFDDGFKNGIHGLVEDDGAPRDKEAWGSIAAWAWGLSRAMDYLETDPDVDPNRVAVFGHSRLGKTSLWAGAEDERFALVISNNSGCGGAALSRRPFGERVSKINTSFPHWFAARFHEYNDNEAALPVDQHMLLALMAPRPLYVASAQDDEWADPYGEYLSLYNGSRVYGLYGESPLVSDQLPGINEPRWSGSLGYHIRTGKHGVTRYDWEQYLDFADEQMPAMAINPFPNPVSVEWIQEHLRTTSPRLILTPEVEARIRKQLDAEEPITQQGMELLRQSAESMLELEPLTYDKQGKRLLGVSREAVKRLTTLALTYRFDKDKRYLDKLEAELTAVCSFKDWNPSHFLDVAEMATGVALALDWTGQWLSPEVDVLVRHALVEYALKPGIAVSENNFWITIHHNWNLVCHGGLALAALALFEEEPELASRVLNQAVEYMPLALEPYAPGGIYPEGPSYWFYATTYLTVAISGFESALGTDFGFTAAPGVVESAVFSSVTAGPSGEYYNYFDASLGGFNSLTHFGLLSWFSSRSGQGIEWTTYDALLKKELSNPRAIRGTRFFSTHFLNSIMVTGEAEEPFVWPHIWWGEGEEPIIIFRDEVNHKNAFFLAAKGGMAGDNHGNMDAGSFILELNGIRWSVDPGNQSYSTLEELIGEELWNNGQESRRWSLLTKNNFGHSTLTVNKAMHRVDGRALLVGMELRGPTPEFTFRMTDLYGNLIQEAHRSFLRPSATSLLIRDNLVFSPETRTLTWQMITQAEVQVKKKGVVLEQNGKSLYLDIDKSVPFEVKVVNLSPPPLTYDKDIPGLKRIEVWFQRSDFPGDSGQIEVELHSDPR